MFRAICNVNRLIFREKNCNRLLKGVCDCLVETRGYQNAWIAVFDEFGRLKAAAESGLGQDFLPVLERLKCGQLTYCGRNILKQPGVVAIKDPLSTCADCPLSSKYSGTGAMAVRLECEGKVYGLLSASIPVDFIMDGEEQALFREVAGDVAFALHTTQFREPMQGLSANHEQLLQSAKMATIGELVSSVLHELNNPLTTIIMCSELLLEEIGEEGAKNYVQTLYREAERAITIVKNLLSFARKHKSKRDYISINESLDSAVELRAYERNLNNIKVIMELDPDLPNTMGDFHQLQQVFFNLITNAEHAVKSAHGKGNLVIRTQKVDEIIQITFTDNGMGIPTDNLGKIFEPFFTTKDVGQGTGLGLSICHGIIQEHGGRIYVESVEGNGATFVVEIPIVAKMVDCAN